MAGFAVVETVVGEKELIFVVDEVIVVVSTVFVVSETVVKE